MNIFTGKAIGGRPCFQNAKHLEKPAKIGAKEGSPEIKFISKNELLSKNAPTVESSLFQRIVDWFNRTFKALFTFVQRPDAFKERNIWFSSGKLPAHLELSDIVAHYGSFIEGEKESPELKKCLKQFEADIQDRNNYELQAKMADLFNLTEKEKIEAAKKTLVAQKLDALKALKEGEVRLFDLNGVACLWSQHQGKYTLQLVGPYSEMTAFQPKTLALGGKAKIQRSIVFENIPASDLFDKANGKDESKTQAWIAQWLDDSLGAQQQAAWLTDLAKYRKEVTSLKQLKTQDERIDKVYWNVIAAIREATVSPKQDNSFKNQHKQVQLRAHLAGLFDFFKKERYSLSQNQESFFREGTFDELKTMHKNVAANCLRAYRKKQINKQEFEEIRVQLDTIAEALAKATPPELALPSKLALKHPEIPTAKLSMLETKPISMSIKKDNEADALKKALHLVDELVPPVIAPMAPVGIPIPTSTPYLQIKSKEEFLEHLRGSLALPDQKEKNVQLLQLFSEVPFAPFNDINVQDKKSFWWDLDPQEQKEVMEVMHQCASELFSGDKKQMEKIRSELTQFQYEALLKMIWIVMFIESQSLKVRLCSGYHMMRFEEYIGSRDPELIGKNVNYAFDKERKDVEHTYRKVSSSSSLIAKELINVCKSVDAQNLENPADKHTVENAFTTKLGLILAKINNPNGGSHSILEINGKYSKTGIFEKWSPTWLPGELKNWIRPINHPFLAALYRNTSSFIAPLHDKGNPILNPESFQAQPQAVFNEIKRVFEELQKASNAENFGVSENITFSQKEQQALLRLVRLADPQIELLSFMKEFPHLFKHACVRNFFDALFFNTSLHIFLKDNCKKDLDPTFLEKEIPQQIQDMINRLERQLEEGRQDPQVNEELLNQRFDALVYFYEMKEKLRHVYETHHSEQFRESSKSNPISTVEFKPSLEDVARLRQLALTDKRFSSSAASTALLHLNLLLSQENVAPQSVPQIIFDYMLVLASPRNSPNIDPAVEEGLKLKWKDIIRALKQNHKQLPMDSINLTMNHLCYLKGLAQPKAEWKPIDGSPLKFRAGDYTVDLETMSISIASLEKAEIALLPEKIVKNPAFMARFPKLAGKSIPANSQEINGETIYTFYNTEGKAQHVTLEESGNMRFYTEITVDGASKLVQEFSPSTFKKISDAILEELRKKIDRNASFLSNLWNGSKNSKIFAALSENLLPPLFFEQFYLDPSNPSHGYKLNDKNEVLFEVVFKETKEGLGIDYVIDRRTDNKEHWQVNTGQEIKELDFFKKIENTEQLILWSQKGQLKKVELQRYGLTFVWDKEEWKCLNKELEGYKLQTNATLKDKQGIEHSLLLRHPDPTKPRKLIVPDSENLVQVSERLEPKANGWLGSIIIAMDTMRQMAQAYLGVQQERSLIKSHLVFDNQATEIKHTILDLRPFTEEICVNESTSVSNLLNLAVHALKTDQPVLALQMIQKIDFKTFCRNQKTLKLMSAFLKKETGSPAEAALKFKLCCNIFDTLADQRLSTKPLRKVLRKTMLTNGKIILTGGRKIPPQLQLSHRELIQLGVVAKKLDPEFYVNHLQAHLLAKHKVIADAIDQKRFDEIKKEWKTIKADQSYEKQMEKLEAYLSANPLTDADLSAPIARTPGAPLLFNPNDVEFLFKRIQPELPDLKLQIQRKDPKIAAKNAIEAFQKDIDAYRKKELERPLFEINADPAALKKFSDKMLKPKLLDFSQGAERLKAEIDQYMQKAKTADEQLAIYSGEKQVATLDLLRDGLTTNSLQVMQEAGSIPASVDLKKLQTMLTNYFELLSKRHAAAACMRAIDDLEYSESRNNPILWKSVSMSLYRLLTIQRYYDPAKDPRPLVFEAQQFVNFRCLDGGLDQLDLLDALMANPTIAIQAPTGAGKTSILSTLRSLLKANGRNLIVQKVTSPLYNQTYDKLKEVLGGLFGRVIYPLRFNLNMPMVELIIQKVKDEKGVEKEISVKSSIFKKMYGEMLEVIQSKGCVLTDYKSLPLLEEKFWKLDQDMMEMQQNGQPIPELQREHFNYLKKILNLLTERVDENMDEFDQPNRPINKIQTDLGMGSHPIPPFLTDISVEIYQQLLTDPILQLRYNVQGDLTEEMRIAAIQRHASQMASKISQAKGLNQEKLLDYFLGKNENIFEELKDSQDFDLLDKITLCKDQFYTFLPLTLRGKRKGKYARSDDGSRTVPCFNGVKHEAKPGTIQEQINYAIQDYLQGGITLYDFNLWSKELKKEFEELDPASPRREVLENELQRILPGCSLAGLINPDLMNRHIQQINQDPAKIIEFLKTQLGKLKTSGAVISMGPLDIINMNRVTSGMSATSGDPETLHNNFKMDLEQKGAIRANMALRVCQRSENVEVMHYDPRNPLEVVKAAQKNAPLSAIIDGAGLFNEDAYIAVKQLLDSPIIKQVGYHKDGAIVYEGQATGKVENTGFLFTQDQTRGTDIPLAPDARALLTITESDGIGDFFQKEGRLRIETQRFALAVPKYQQHTKFLQQALSGAICVEADQDGKDIYRKCKQELQAYVRKEMRKKLLSTNTVEEFLELFKNPKISSLFITPPAVHYANAGDYFRAHRHIRQEDCKPEVELEALRKQYIKLAEELDLPEAIKSINGIKYTPQLIAKMPGRVAALSADELEMEHEVEVEVEQEVQVEQQLEIEAEIEKELEKVVGAGDLINFPLRLQTKVNHSLAEQSKIPYDDRIYFSDAFVPLSRKNTASLLKKELWGGDMYRVGALRLYITFSGGQTTLKKIVLDDPIEKEGIGEYRFEEMRGNGLFAGSSPEVIKYDLRTGKVTQFDKDVKGLSKALASEQVVQALAQIKFMDGMTSGYSAEEIEGLKKWIATCGKEKMHKHFMDTVLRYRGEDRKAYEGSQLQREVFA